MSRLAWMTQKEKSIWKKKSPNIFQLDCWWLLVRFNFKKSKIWSSIGPEGIPWMNNYCYCNSSTWSWQLMNFFEEWKKLNGCIPPIITHIYDLLNLLKWPSVSWGPQGWLTAVKNVTIAWAEFVRRSKFTCQATITVMI